MITIENHVATVEKFLNPIDRIPGISSFTGMVRILAGAVEIAAGIVFGIMSYLLAYSHNRVRELKPGLIYALHGLGNICRGSICMIPFVNMGLYFYDTYFGRMNYQNEVMSAHVYPIMTAHTIQK